MPAQTVVASAPSVFMNVAPERTSAKTALATLRKSGRSAIQREAERETNFAYGIQLKNSVAKTGKYCAKTNAQVDD